MLQIKLIRLYFYICKLYEKELKWQFSRQTKNQVEPLFTDQELLTSYLFCVGNQKRFTIKSLHQYLVDHWIDWFPQLPSYQAYNRRINDMSGALVQIFRHLAAYQIQHNQYDPNSSLTDSMPIITCRAVRKAKVAPLVCTKTYCASKRISYYGVKLHGIAWPRAGKLPVLEHLFIQSAHVHDLKAQQAILATLKHRTIWADRAFISQDLSDDLERVNSQILTPVKQDRYKLKALKQRDEAADEWLSSMISSQRQPIESLFAWLIEKVDIQRASKVRSLAGLMRHIFGRLAAAFYFLIFCP